MGNCGSEPAAPAKGQGQAKTGGAAQKQAVKKDAPKDAPKEAPKEETKPAPVPEAAKPKQPEATPAPEPEKPAEKPVEKAPEAPKPEPVVEPEPEPVVETPPPPPPAPVPEPEPEPKPVVEPTPEPEPEPETPVDQTIAGLPTVEVQGPNDDDDAANDVLAQSAPAVTDAPEAAPTKTEPPVLHGLVVEEKGKRKVRTLDLEAVKSIISNDTSKYTLGARLGKGAYGVVVRATNEVTGESVAVKKISKEVLAKEGEAGEKRLYREVAIMGALQHPNLVNLIELLHKEESQEVWIVIEVVEGAELMNKIDRESKLSEDLARKYFRQLVCGMYYVHSQGVVHRDLKPENILVTHDDVCKITDFGLSNVQNTDTFGQVPNNLNMKTCCGTPYYVAPEVVTKKEGYNGFTADVWSLGIILYVMVVGDLPFTAKDLRALLRKIGKGDYKIPESAGLSDSCKDLITKTLNTKADERYTLTQISEHPWFVEGGFDRALMDVGDSGLDKTAVDHLQNTLGGWGAMKKKVEDVCQYHNSSGAGK